MTSDQISVQSDSWLGHQEAKTEDIESSITPEVMARSSLNLVRRILHVIIPWFLIWPTFQVGQTQHLKPPHILWRHSRCSARTGTRIAKAFSPFCENWPQRVKKRAARGLRLLHLQPWSLCPRRRLLVLRPWSPNCAFLYSQILWFLGPHDWGDVQINTWYAVVQDACDHIIEDLWWSIQMRSRVFSSDGFNHEFGEEVVLSFSCGVPCLFLLQSHPGKLKLPLIKMFLWVEWLAELAKGVLVIHIYLVIPTDGLQVALYKVHDQGLNWALEFLNSLNFIISTPVLENHRIWHCPVIASFFLFPWNFFYAYLASPMWQKSYCRSASVIGEVRLNKWPWILSNLTINGLKYCLVLFCVFFLIVTMVKNSWVK
jgi:hypothetical protein